MQRVSQMAFAEFALLWVGGWLVVHGIKVKRQGSQYKVLFPERKLYAEVYKPVVTALNPEFKKEVDALILSEFYKALENK